MREWPSLDLRVLQLCAPARFGGLERVVQNLSSGLAARGVETTVAAVTSSGSDAEGFFGQMRNAGVRTVHLAVHDRGYLRERALVRRLIEEVRPHVLHSHGYRSDLLHRGGAQEVGVTCVSTLHGTSRMGGLSSFLEWSQERLVGLNDAVVVVSKPLEDMLRARGVREDRVHLVPNAWEPSTDLLSPQDARLALSLPPHAGQVIGWVGRLLPIKGCDIFIRALARLGDTAFTACVIGDGPDRPALEELTRTLGIAGRVRFVGALPDAHRLFPAFDIFVMSSRSEGTPLALLEAIGARVPTVATSVGGIPDVIAHDRSGLLVPTEHPEALAAAVRGVLGDPMRARRMAEQASASLRASYALEPWVERHLDVYKSAWRERTRRTGENSSWQ